MNIHFTQKDDSIETHDYKLAYDGQKLTITVGNNKQNVRLLSGEAYTYSGEGDLPSIKNGMERGNLILFALGIPTDKWIPSIQKFDATRQAIIDSHEVKISDTYVHFFYSYMTKHDGRGNEVLLMAWVSDEVNTSQQLNEIVRKLAPFGTDNKGFLVLV